MNDPFAQPSPSPLCRQAVSEVLAHIEASPQLLEDARRGKMLGVLIVELPETEDSGSPISASPASASPISASPVSGSPVSASSISAFSASCLSVRHGCAVPSKVFLAAYSGLLAGRNDWPFFVPPVFDAQQPDGHFKQTEARITALNRQIAAALEAPAVLEALKRERKALSESLQQWLFSQYRLLNAHGECKDLIEIWRSYHQSPRLQQRFPLPPGGSGDCCAPKLLQYAYEHHLKPLEIAEFWYGESPRGEVRHHLAYYPACRGKCKPILTHMLKGLEIEKSTRSIDLSAQLKTLYDDEAIVVVGKPSGLLSVPGKDPDEPSVERILSERYGRVWMPHRLDQDTSGLLVVARTEESYHHLQQQFLKRTVAKCYVALLVPSSSTSPFPRPVCGDAIAALPQPLPPSLPQPSHPQAPLPRPVCGDAIAALPSSLPSEGTISLPLRPDPLDRPRQVVDHAHGKRAETRYRILGTTPEGYLRVLLTPKTGRTHQLRMHCAHQEGLAAPILGDPLYGSINEESLATPATRLHLHAQDLCFLHPLTEQPLQFHLPAPF